jgi:thioesterase domain-containing protein/acyl carrier protein
MVACRVVAPPNLIEERLAEIWCRALDLDTVDRRADFFQLGGESIAAARVLVEIQRTFARRLPLTVLHEAPTVEALAKVISRQAGLSPWGSLVRLQPHGSNPPFFCVHGAGGTVLCLTDLARHFALHQPFYGIRASDTDGYVQSFQRIEDMAAHYLEEIRDVQPAGPYYLGGYSLGGSVALEMAQQLHARGERVALLAILDHTPPPTRYRRFVWSRTLGFDLAVNVAQWFAEDVWRAGRGRRLAALMGKAKAAKKQLLNLAMRSAPTSGAGDVKEIFAGHELPESFQQLLETHYQALRDYVPKVYPGRVTLFRARVRPLLRLSGRDLGWGKQAGGGLEVITIPGNHETVLKPPNVQLLAEALLAQLDKAQAGP